MMMGTSGNPVGGLGEAAGNGVNDPVYREKPSFRRCPDLASKLLLKSNATDRAKSFPMNSPPSSSAILPAKSSRMPGSTASEIHARPDSDSADSFTDYLDEVATDSRSEKKNEDSSRSDAGGAAVVANKPSNNEASKTSGHAQEKSENTAPAVDSSLPDQAAIHLQNMMEIVNLLTLPSPVQTLATDGQVASLTGQQSGGAQSVDEKILQEQLFTSLLVEEWTGESPEQVAVNAQPGEQFPSGMENETAFLASAEGGSENSEDKLPSSNNFKEVVKEDAPKESPKASGTVENRGKNFPSATNSIFREKSEMKSQVGVEGESRNSGKTTERPFMHPSQWVKVFSALSRDAGTQAALRAGVTDLLTADVPLVDLAAPALSGLASGRNSAHAPSSSTTEPVRLNSLIERVRQTVESQRPPEPRRIAFQLDPPKLGVVQMEMQWTPKGWNINWTVTRSEVRDWLVQQLPFLQQQQQNTAQPIIWQAPTLQTAGWDFSRQEQSGFFDRPNGESLLADEEAMGEEDDSPRSNEFWA